MPTDQPTQAGHDFLLLIQLPDLATQTHEERELAWGQS
jgi:hypothetical protein